MSQFEESECLLVLPGGNWDDHETMYRNRGIVTKKQLSIISAKARDGVSREEYMRYIESQPDSDVQYKLLMQFMKIRKVDRPTVRAWVKVTKADIEYWQELRGEGLSDEKIAEKVGRARGTIWCALARESGLSVYSPDKNRVRDRRSNNKPMSKRDIQRARELCHQGMSASRVGRLMNRHHSTILKHVKGS